MRTVNSIKNVKYSFLGQIVNLLLTFVTRTIFIKVLGIEYLGISGLFTNLLSILSLAELGVSSSIAYSLYRPLAEKDEIKLKAIMGFYAKAYKAIGLVIALVGILIIPFLGVIIKDISFNNFQINLIYILFLTNTVISYFFSYKSTILIADQKSYVVTLNQYMFMVIQNSLQILILLITKNYILYLFLQILITLLTNIVIAKKANKEYPFLLGDNTKLDENTKNEIYKNTSAMMFHKFGAVIVTGTDNILLSKFIGFAIVGIYSNYMLIVNIISALTAQIFTTLTSSIGNLNVEGNNEKKYFIYEKIFFLNFWIISFCSISLFILLNPFVKLWIGREFILSKQVIFCIILNFFINGLRNPTIVFINAMGLFWKIRYKSLFEAIINLVFSILLITYFGISGVVIGTIFSTLTTNFWWEPYVVYKYGFNKELKYYFQTYLKYMIIFSTTLLISDYIANINIIQINTLFFYKTIICLVVPNMIYLTIFWKNDNFIYFKNIIITIFLGFKNKI